MSFAKACIIGHPVAHSRSPLLHGFWLRNLGIAGSYERCDVAPDGLASALTSLKARGFVGGNITVPHKQAAFALVGRHDAAAAAVGAVNTLWFEGEMLVGGNTDGAGFLAALDTQAPGWRGARRALVLGAGGAAAAILHALDGAGLHVTLANRTLARAQALAARFPGTDIAPWEGTPGPYDLLVNTTSLGMAGQPPLPIDLTGLPAHAVVADIVYVPLETPLLAAARGRGLCAVDGLGMLLHQAVPGFARWFGQAPRVTPELRALLLADLQRK